MKKHLIILFYLIGIIANGQPGGGGGLSINHFYDKNGNEIIFSDTSLRVRAFLLKDDSTFSQITQEIFFSSRISLYLDSDCNKYYQSETNIQCTNQRLYIIYKNDTTILDFIGITTPNGGGNIDLIDSLIIKPGYYRYKKGADKGFYSDWKIEVEKKVDVSFLKEVNLPSTFYLRRGGYYIMNNYPELGIADINKAFQIGINKKEIEEAYIYLCDRYERINDFKMVILYSSHIININRYEERNYYRRINALTKANKFTEALKDYNALVGMSEYKLVGRAEYKLAKIEERALFKIDFLKDFHGVISELHGIIDTIPAKKLSPCPGCQSNFCRTYFILGLAEYRNRDFDLAYLHWLKSMELGYAITDYTSATIHLDSIISKESKNANLLLARGIANYYKAAYLGWGDDTKKCFNSSLSDISKAESLGLKDYKINLWRAKIQMELGEYKAALDQINLAISKNKMNPICYTVRYDIRSKLGQTVWGNAKDADLLTALELSANWEFDK